MDPPTPHLLSSAGALQHISVVLSLEPQHIYLTLTLQGCCEVFSGINLMLYKSFVSPIMTNLQQLPEVDAGLNQPNRPPAVQRCVASVCASAHPCATERRLTLTPPAVHRGLHTSFVMNHKWRQAI